MVAQLRTPSMATNAPDSAEEAEATPPLFDKATLILLEFGVGVTVGVGVGVIGVGVGVAGVGVGVVIGVEVGGGVVVTVVPLQASSSTIRL